MSDQFKEILDIPRDFLHDGTQFMNRFALSSSLKIPLQHPNQKHRCTKRKRFHLCLTSYPVPDYNFIADKREFLKISQAVSA